VTKAHSTYESLSRNCAQLYEVARTVQPMEDTRPTIFQRTSHLNHEHWCELLRGRRLPAVVIDLDALEHNEGVLLSQLGPAPLTLRIATKSIRIPWVLRHLLERNPSRFRGLMTYSPFETERLFTDGFDDFLLAYPVARTEEAAALAGIAARGARLSVVVDNSQHLKMLAAAATSAGTTIGICIDVDVSWRPLGASVHFGVRRSPIRSADEAVRLAQAIAGCDGLRLTGIMAYEAQVAGVRETNPSSRLIDPIRRLVKHRSRPLAETRRREVVQALTADGHDLTLINGGGTGSIVSTSADPSVTEVGAGSGFYCPHLFDHFDGLPLRPAAFFAIGVVRTSDPGFITCAGGGFVASGPPGDDRQPRVHLPNGLAPIAMEGFGEVQTPLKVSGRPPELGDPVICRHAKAGELMEHVDSVLLVRGTVFETEAPTYRGLRTSRFSAS
jgi:D-serine deaminase-like pyridoxal phosphate-dependent protein